MRVKMVGQEKRAVKEKVEAALENVGIQKIEVNHPVNLMNIEKVRVGATLKKEAHIEREVDRVNTEEVSGVGREKTCAQRIEIDLMIEIMSDHATKAARSRLKDIIRVEDPETDPGLEINQSTNQGNDLVPQQEIDHEKNHLKVQNTEKLDEDPEIGLETNLEVDQETDLEPDQTKIQAPDINQASIQESVLEDYHQSKLITAILQRNILFRRKL